MRESGVFVLEDEMKKLFFLILLLSIIYISTSGSAIAGWSVVESGAESMLRGVWVVRQMMSLQWVII